MKRNIAIIMGGYSSEYAISLKSGNVVYEHLDREKFNPYRILIAQDRWVYLDEKETEHPVDRHDFSVPLAGSRLKFDCVFNAIHGTPGEDGYMQAYFDLLGIPQTSCNHYQAGLTFNKRDLLSVLRPFGVLSARSFYVNQGDDIDYEDLAERVGLPCFVKANRAGSSFGITKVKEISEFPAAFEKAFREDPEVLVEAALVGTEVSVGVIRFQGKIKVLPPTEIVTENEFFDFEAKYEGKAEEITPARISEDAMEMVTSTAYRIYDILKMRGFSRSEFILQEGIPYMLEMNTTPGLTEESLLPQQARAAGITLPELFEDAIRDALGEFD